MIPKDWMSLPMWEAPLEPLTAEAIELMCDADRRPEGAMKTLIVKLS